MKISLSTFIWMPVDMQVQMNSLQNLLLWYANNNQFSCQVLNTHRSCLICFINNKVWIIASLLQQKRLVRRPRIGYCREDDCMAGFSIANICLNTKQSFSGRPWKHSSAHYCTANQIQFLRFQQQVFSRDLPTQSFPSCNSHRFKGVFSPLFLGSKSFSSRPYKTRSITPRRSI